MDLLHWVVPRPPLQDDLGRRLRPPLPFHTYLDGFASTCLALQHLFSWECVFTWAGGTGHTTSSASFFLATGVPPSTCSATSPAPMAMHWATLVSPRAWSPSEDHHVASGHFSVYSALPPQRYLRMLCRRLHSTIDHPTLPQPQQVHSVLRRI